MLNNFGSNFKRQFKSKRGYINDYQIDHILESWDKYSVEFNNNRLMGGINLVAKKRLGQQNLILLFPDSNVLIYTTFNIGKSMSYISNIMDQCNDLQYKSTIFQLKYYNYILSQVSIGPTFIVVDLPMNAIIIDKQLIPEYNPNNLNANNNQDNTCVNLNTVIN